MQCVASKGQIKLKADWQALDSPKKQTDEFVLFAFLLFMATNHIRLFVFWKNLRRSNLLFGFILLLLPQPSILQNQGKTTRSCLQRCPCLSCNNTP